MTDPVLRLDGDDAGELLTLQRAAWVQEAIANGTLDIPPLHDSLADVTDQLADPLSTIWGVRRAGRLVATVRTRFEGGEVAYLGRLGVAPDMQGHGLGRYLLDHAERQLPAAVATIELISGARSYGNHAFYGRNGYVLVGEGTHPGTVLMVKALRPATR